MDGNPVPLDASLPIYYQASTFERYQDYTQFVCLALETIPLLLESYNFFFKLADRSLKGLSILLRTGNGQRDKHRSAKDKSSQSLDRNHMIAPFNRSADRG